MEDFSLEYRLQLHNREQQIDHLRRPTFHQSHVQPLTKIVGSSISPRIVNHPYKRVGQNSTPVKQQVNQQSPLQRIMAPSWPSLLSSKSFYFANSIKAFDINGNQAFYEQNRQLAYYGLHPNVFYFNGQKAFDGISNNAYFEDGTSLVKRNGISYCKENVTLVFRENKYVFTIDMGGNFLLVIEFEFEMSLHVIRPKKGKISLYSDGKCIHEKPYFWSSTF